MEACPIREEPRQPALYTADFLALVGIQIAFSFSFSTFFLLPKYMAVELGAAPAAIGVVTAMFGLSGLAAIPVVGSGIDRVPRRHFLVAGSALMAAAAFAFLLVDRAGVLAAGLRFAQGLAWAMVFTASLALTSDTVPPTRLAESLGIVGGASLMMNAVAPAVAEPLAERAGFASAFALAAVAALISVGLSLRTREVPAHFPNAPPSLRALLRRPIALHMAAVLGSAGAAFGVMFTFHQPLALQVGIRQVRGFFIAYTVGALVVRLGLGRVADRVGRRAVAAAALVLYGLSVLGMQGLTSAKLWIFGGLFGVAHGFFFPAYNAMLLGGVAREDRGKLMTLSNAFFSLGSASVIGLGFVVERLGYGVVFQLAGCAALAASALLILQRRRSE